MKIKNLLLLVPITLSAALFVGYQTWDGTRTDLTPPEFSISQETVQVSVSAPKTALLQGITARDDRDGDVTDSLLVEKISMLDGEGTVEVSFAAFDRSGNVSKGTRTARYTDYRGPRFYLNRSLAFASETGFDLMAAVNADDPLDGNIQHRIRATSQDDSAVNNLGEHRVEFRVTNSLSDTVRLTLPVLVYSGEEYSLGVVLSDYMVYLNKGDTFDARSCLSQVKRGQDVVSFEDGTPDGYAVRIDGEVNTAAAGVYAVDYIVTNIQQTATGNRYTSGISRLIVVVEG